MHVCMYDIDAYIRTVTDIHGMSVPIVSMYVCMYVCMVQGLEADWGGSLVLSNVASIRKCV